MPKPKRKPTKAKPTNSVDDDLGFRRRRTALRVRRKPGEKAWELVHPRCALERSEDLEEVQQMVEEGEIDIALDELRWLLNGCGDFVAAHRLLGELAIADGDLKLARAHFGYAYEIALSACPAGGLDAPLPYRLVANRAFLEAAKGLAGCLHELGKHKLAGRVLEQLLACDPSDPLNVRPWQDAWMREDAPIGEGERITGDSAD
jgi:tetratricopeptide (TPR) repeat protein